MSLVEVLLIDSHLIFPSNYYFDYWICLSSNFDLGNVDYVSSNVSHGSNYSASRFLRGYYDGCFGGLFDGGSVAGFDALELVVAVNA